MLIQTYTDVNCHWLFLSLSYTEQWQEQLCLAHLAPFSLPGQHFAVKPAETHRLVLNLPCCRKGQGVGVTQQQWFWRNPLPLSLEAKFSVMAMTVLLQCKHLMIASARREWILFSASEGSDAGFLHLSHPSHCELSPRCQYYINIVLHIKVGNSSSHSKPKRQ